jgi:hypothetical protein
LKPTLLDQNLTFAAGLLPTTNAFNFNAQIAGCVKQDGALGNLATPPRRLEDDTMFWWVGHYLLQIFRQ